MLRYIRLAVIALIVPLTATAAGAIGRSSLRSDIVISLKNTFGEVKVGFGLSSGGHLVEIFVSPAGGWTILLSRLDGMSCMVDSGEAWTMTPPVMPSREAALPLRLALRDQVPSH